MGNIPWKEAEIKRSNIYCDRCKRVIEWYEKREQVMNTMKWEPIIYIIPCKCEEDE